MQYGIDISNWQDLQSPGLVRGNGISFAYCKASEGNTYTDTKFKRFVKLLSDVNIECGPYHFARPGSASSQANYFKKIFTRSSVTLWPALDMEDNSISNKDSFICEFYDTLNCEGMLVYANQYWMENYLNPVSWGRRNILIWIASPNGNPGHPLWTNKQTALHQHSTVGKVPGIPGNIDRDCTMSGYSLPDITMGANEMIPTSQWDGLTGDNYDVPWRDDNASNPKYTLKSVLESIWEITTECVQSIRVMQPQLAALTKTVAALSDDPNIDENTLRTMIDNAVAQNINITGTVEITGDKNE